MGICCSTSNSKIKGHTLGGGNTEISTPPDAQAQMLAAAEKRLKAQQGSGKLGKKLKEQNAIGPGRAIAQPANSNTTLQVNL
jgi:hypothetical protein